MENEEETTTTTATANHQLLVNDDESPETTGDNITITSIDNESDNKQGVMSETNIQQENTVSPRKSEAFVAIVDDVVTVVECGGGSDVATVECGTSDAAIENDKTVEGENVNDVEKQETLITEEEEDAEIVAQVVKQEDEKETAAHDVEKSLLHDTETEIVEKDDIKEQGDESETMITEDKGDGKEEDALMANDETMITQERVAVMEDDALMENDEKQTVAQDMEKTLDDTETETDKLTMQDQTETKLDKLTDTEMEDENEANLIASDEDKGQEDEAAAAALNESETELPESSSKKGGGNQAKRKKGGKVSKATSKSPRKIIEEDVCFICFDGGDLVLCDRRNCPKVYHPACVSRNDAFFQSKGRWDCGWHQCSMCEKKAEYMCYTCTFSLCKGCIKTHGMLCVREKEKKGLCEACVTTIMKIEKPDDQGDVNFDDKNSWEHLFKDYWIEMKAKNNLSFDELAQAKNPWKGLGKRESLIAQSDVKDDDSSGPDNLSGNPKARKSKRNAKKQKSAAKVDDFSTGDVAAVDSEGSLPENAELISKELLEFVMHMRGGDSSAITKSEVQDLLLEYIKRNKLRDPSRKGFVICDARLVNLFSKPRVAHIEMLKLLESHFFMEGDSQIDDLQETVVDTEVSPVDDKDRKRKGRKKVDRRGPQSNRDDYATIDIHNISMIYLRRKLVEDLLDDMEAFHEKVVGTFVRIRISGANQKQDIYRLVQVKGTSEAAQYTLGKRMTCTMLEILNLDKTETISIDSISNQEFMEDECKRLRQSIKCGLIKRPTVGDVLDKAMELQVVRVNDWLETEVVRLSHLRDRASDLGRKKELRECVEKLNVLKMPEERARRLEEIPLIHDDPTMDPEHESEDDTDLDDKKQELHKRSDSFRLNKRGRDQFSPRGDYSSKESWSGTPRSSSAKNYEFSRSLSNRNLSTKAEDASTSSFEMHTDNSQDQGRETFVQQPIILEKPSVPSPRGTPAAPESAPKVNETEKMWHYKDPSEKIQGPFSMVQLRKWSKNGYFPAGLKIWRKSDKEDDGILLSDALEGKFPLFDLQTSLDGHILNHDRSHGQSQLRNRDTVEKPNLELSHDSRHNIAKLPSPTPNIATTGWTGGQAGSHAGPGSYPSGNEGMQSPTPNSSLLGGSSVSSLVKCGNNEPGSVGVSTFKPRDSITPVSVAVAPLNIDQGIQSSVQSSQLAQQVAPPGTNMPPQMVQTLSGQIPQGWSNAPPMILQPNPSMNIAGLQQVYNQWSGVPNMVQNPVGNFMTAPQEQWGQYPFPVSQPNMQQQPQQQQPQHPPQPPQANASWGTMTPTPNMGWISPNTGTPINWGPMVPGPQVTGNVDPTWVMQPGSIGPVPGNVQAGWVPQPAVQGVLPNQTWVATPIQGPVVAGNGNPGWVAPPGTQVAPNAAWAAPAVNQGPASMNSGWVGGPGNQGAPFASQGPGNNLGWVPPTGNQGAPPPPPSPSPSPSGNKSNNQNWGPRNHGNWGGNGNRGGFSGERRNRGGSGFRGNRRNYNNNQESFHKDGGSYHGAGMGDSSRS